MGVYEELVARGLIAQVTDEEEIKELVNNGKAVFYIGRFLWALPKPAIFEKIE